ncbi:MAG: Ig-like domain-containing protein, partial [Chloroflexi bacterium]|nr:Ig-like domain-containing protein [Chloroflexota bacterium]
MNQLLSKAYILGLRAMGERRRITLAVFLLAAVSLSMSVWLGATATATHVPGGHLAAVGPVNAQTHFAEWYEDSNGLQLKLCINDAFLCINDPVDPGNALSVESGFGAEAFWWAADAHMPVGTGGSALLVLAVEAAYANDDPEANAQMSFGRIRVRASGLVPGASYRVIHPYGEKDYVAEAGAVSIRDTIDIGCLGVIPGAVACDWNLARLSNVGPFLVWDPAVAPEAPPGAIGNPAVEHKVIGSPFGTNHFRIEGLNAGGPGVNFAQTDLFLVQGKLFDNPPTAVNDAVNIPVGSTARPIDVLANDSDRDGNTITVSAVTQPASGAVAIEAGAGRVIFTPGAAGSQTFNYTASSTMPGNPT